ncbi:MAG TPA: hypothetical protein VE646_03695, partial [Actinomycetota bacterium]|nr:hypothetical protein [Actinomycetota bacterium]
MDPIQYLRAFRRRWAVIVAAVLVAAAAGWLTTSTVAPVRAAPQRYSATALLGNGTSSTVPGVPILDVPALVRVATLPDVVDLAAKELGWTGDPSVLAGNVQVTPDPQSDGFLDITGTATGPRQAERIAEAFSNALIAFV